LELILEKIAKQFGEMVKKPIGKDVPTLYIRIYNLIREMILKMDLPENEALPASRVLAKSLGVSRSTIIRVYELLRLEGFVYSKQGAGHNIKPLQKKTNRQPLDQQIGYPALSKLGQSFLNNAGLINSTDEKSVAFRPGLPPLDIFPVSQWKNLSNQYWKNIKLSNLSYSPASGIDQLKLNIANYLNLSRNLKCDADQILIVSGSLQSLFLVGTSVIDAGDCVVMENPTFPNVHSIFKGLMAHVQGIKLDKEGLSVDELNDLKTKPKLIHTTPSSHYPTGIKMSLKRREELLAFAHKNASIIIENDYEHELNNWDNPIPSIFSLDKQERTIYLGTFNRLLHPSLRIGYMVMPHYLKNVTDALLKHSHRFVPTSIQVVLNQFIEKKYLYAHIKNVVEVVKVREHFFRTAFASLFSDLNYAIEPSQSLSLQKLIKIPLGLSDKELVKMLGKHNIITHSYNKCFTDPVGKQGLILGYSSIHTPVLKNKLHQMQQILRKGH
jgi:GntR family transcriptional regulator / MocR family aminotransferase